MEDRLGLEPLDRGQQARAVGDVARLQAGPRGDRLVQVLALPGGEIVDHQHLVAALQKRIAEVRTDESGASCDQSFHGLSVPR